MRGCMNCTDTKRGSGGKDSYSTTAKKKKPRKKK